MAIKKGTYKVDNGSGYDEIMFKTLAEQVLFTDGQTFQDKLNNGTLKGSPGTNGAQGPIGPTGPQGPKGTDGAQGIQGPIGPTGPSGATADIVSTNSSGLAPRITNSSFYLRGDGWTTVNWYDISGKPQISKDTKSSSIKINDTTNNVASGEYSLAMGTGTTAIGYCSHAEGEGTKTNNSNSHAEGYKTITNGNHSHAEGFCCQTLAVASHAEGSDTRAIGSYSHAEGYQTSTKGNSSHAEGYKTIANANYSHAEGYCTTAECRNQTVIGMYNVPQGSSSTSPPVSTDAVFIIGNGNSTTLSNAFRFTYAGQLYAKGAYSSTGADYAEMFEWSDGNTNNEERIGFFVAFDKNTEKIRKANSSDNYILGVVSVNTAILGDNYDEEWKNKYVRDKWGRIKYEKIIVPPVIEKIQHPAKYEEILNEETGELENVMVKEPYEEEIILAEECEEERPILNPNYILEENYIPRENRPEWSPIGLLGKLLVHDDGTCQVGGFCKPNDDGIATKSDSGSGYYVLEKHDDLVKILFK